MFFRWTMTVLACPPERYAKISWISVVVSGRLNAPLRSFRGFMLLDIHQGVDMALASFLFLWQQVARACSLDDSTRA